MLAATVAAAVTVPLSLAGTAAGMWAMGFSLNNYSLMAITISVGFVVDDAIVMIENITRLREQGMGTPAGGARRLEADRLHRDFDHPLARRGVHPVAVHGRAARASIFHEFAFTLTIAICLSAVVSLTLTPMVCGADASIREPTGWLKRADRRADRSGVFQRGHRALHARC